jgi:heme/copper-type cytochrome/quinol oxidase subunit 4
MKSRLRNVIHLVAFGLWSILTVLALALVAASLPAHAHETWQVDPQLSI